MSWVDPKALVVTFPLAQLDYVSIEHVKHAGVELMLFGFSAALATFFSWS